MWAVVNMERRAFCRSFTVGRERVKCKFGLTVNKSVIVFVSIVAT